MTARDSMMTKVTRDLNALYKGAIRSWQRSGRYLQLSLAGVSLVLLAVLMYVGHNWYVTRANCAAQLSYASLAQLADDAQRGGAREGWMQVERVAKDGYEKHAGSSFAPYFKLVESQALEKLDDMDAALAAAQEAANLSRTGPLAASIQFRAAFMDEKPRALEKLKKLASEKEFGARDAALYMLGRYYWAEGELEDAANLWQELVQLYRTPDGFSSPYAQDAARLLEYMP